MNRFARQLSILLIPFLLFTGTTYAQDKYNDSIYAVISSLDYAKEWPRLEQKIKQGKATTDELFKAAVLRRDRADESISYLNKALTQSTKGSDQYAVILFARSFAYKKRSDYAREKADLENLSVSYPNFKYALINLSFLLTQEEAYDRAISVCQRILKLDPYKSIVYNNLAYAYAESGQYKNAIDAGEKGIKLKTTSEITGALLNNTGYSRAMLGGYKKGLAEIEESIRIYPKNPYAYFNKGRVYIKMNQKEQACAAFRKAHDLGAVNLTSSHIKKYCQ